MTKRMLVDATHPEETRVAIVDERRLEDFDFESTGKKQLKGNIYLAKVIRIEPSLQAAFVEYGGNRHGFLPFTEIHPDYFRIPMADRPHDEQGDDAQDYESDEDIETNKAIEQEVQAYRNEPEHEQEHSHDPSHFVTPEILPEIIELLPDVVPASESQDSPQAERLATETVTVAVETPVESAAITDAQESVSTHVAGLGPESIDELGLITDFGHAAVDQGGFVPSPVEVVGGEVVVDEEEIEERIRHKRRPNYKIQEVVKRRQIMLIQVVKEERGNKGAALTTFLSLAGRYCVLMPNTDRGGGVSRKITSHQDRRRMKEILDQLETPEGMAVILRTAGMEQEPAEIQRDLEHLLRLWNNIREQTLASTAPTLIYEEANLIKRSMRDLYSADVAEILVAGAKGYHLAYDFMRSIMPDDLGKVRQYEDPVPLFFRYNVEKQIDQLYNPVVQLRSGGYIVINPTEALVSIDVNSGRATRERHIEGTALKTNLEAADEVARQLRLRDLAGLVVIDFIDMEDGRNNAAVERRMKEAMKADRARLQIGRISPFGLMELSRQRLHPSLTEINFEHCPHCAGLGLVRSVDSSAISILRMIEEDGIRQTGGEMVLHVHSKVALYILNQKRSALSDIERRYNLTVLLHSDDSLVPPDYKMERVRAGSGERVIRGPAVNSDQILANNERIAVSFDADDVSDIDDAAQVAAPPREDSPRSEGARQESDRNGRRRGRFGRGRDRNDRNGEPRGERPDRNRDRAPVQANEDRPLNEANGNFAPQDQISDDNIGNSVAPEPTDINGNGESPRQGQGERQGEHRQGGRRRGRRGGRGRRNGGERPVGEAGEIRAEGSEPRPEGTPRPEGERPARRPDNRPDNRGGRNQNGRDNNRDNNRDRRPSYDRNDNNAPLPNIPVSIHDLDTTPRPPHMDPKPTASAPPPSPYEVTNEGPDKPKGGWWRKLTGQ